MGPVLTTPPPSLVLLAVAVAASAALPAAAADDRLTIAAPAPAVVFGRSLALSVTTSASERGKQVSVFAKPFGSRSAARVARIVTSDGGSWGVKVRPTVGTRYQARSRDARSRWLAVGVRPSVTLVMLAGGRFLTKVAVDHPLRGRFVSLQRRGSGGWVSVKRVFLGSSSSARFGLVLPAGRSLLRILVPAGQVGPGYLGGVSRTLAFSNSEPPPP